MWHDAAASAAVPHGDLTRLLETERRLEERLRAARVEAQALVAHARTEADAREAALAAELEAEGRELEARLAGDLRRRQTEIADAARREAEGYDRVPAARVAAVARTLLRSLLT